MHRTKLTLLLIVVLLLAFQTANAEQKTLTILHAGSLSVPLDTLAKAYMKSHPDVVIKRESAGSRTTARKVSELGKEADLVGVADYLVIEDLLMPKFADWQVIFASNEMVIAYSEHSKFAGEINEDNWYEVLLRKGVEYGHSDPNRDPCGYRSRMVMQLAEKHYKKPGLAKKLKEGCPAKNIRPKETDLIALIEAGELDYMFQYRSVAVQHGLKFLPLPKQINLSDVDLGALYKTAEVEVSGKKPGEKVTYHGTPITYGITIPNNAPNPELALDFLKFILGQQGRETFDKLGQPPIVPAKLRGNNIPAELKAFGK